ncbi:MAG: Ribosome recycling factor, partial [uncultured Friedmanniella sp.]
GDPHRSGPPGDVREADRRLLRRPDPAPAAGHLPGARGARRPHHPLRPVLGERDREVDPRLRPRRQPVQRRQDHPGDPAAAHRAAAQGVHQAGEDQVRGRPDLRPRCPSDRQGRPRQDGQGQGGRRGRGRAGGEGAGRRDQEAHRLDRRAVQAQGSRPARRL